MEYRGSTSDLSNTSSGKTGSTKSDYGDGEYRGTAIILEGVEADITKQHRQINELNGRIARSISREEVYKKPINGKVYPDSFESTMSDRYFINNLEKYCVLSETVSDLTVTADQSEATTVIEDQFP